jgi:2-polyprenyl-3-methyl-5-hydroxy-6-metoxy-1,4-benzoquinol methylase
MQSREHTQEAQYGFPYHHIPYFADEATPILTRRLVWGMEYLGYIEVVKQEVARLRPSSILEVGCGDGRVLKELEPHSSARHGCDLSASAIAYAQAFDSTATYSPHPAEHLQPNRYSLVLAVETLEHIPISQCDSFLKTIWGLVDSSGSLILTVPSDARPVHRKHYQHFSVESLTNLLQKSLSSNPVSVAEICSDSRLCAMWQKWTMNRRWTIEFPAVNTLLWRRYVRTHLRPIDRRGTHILALLT